MAGSKKEIRKAEMSEEEMALWEEQIIYYLDHLDIAIEDLCAPIRLTELQHCISRAFGRASDMKIVQSRTRVW